MSERKVLNKYYPPDFDPSKIPKGKRNRNATFNIRIMAPMNMRCNTCKEYIYKGKKFNSRKEDVMDEDYLGLKIFRFYIKCPRCVSEIAFKTDLVNTDYTLEAGATRLFEAEKIAQQMAEQERKEKEEDEMNPMKVLENRTKASRLEMEQIDSLEELRELNSRKNVVNTDEMIEKYRKYEETLQQLQMEAEEKEIQEIFGDKCTKVVKRLHDSDSDDEAPVEKKKAVGSTTSTSAAKPTDILAEETKEPKGKVTQSWERSVGSMTSKSKLKGLVVKKKPSLPGVVTTVRKNSTEKPSDNMQTTGDKDSKAEAGVERKTESCVERVKENENQSASAKKDDVDRADVKETSKSSDTDKAENTQAVDSRGGGVSETKVAAPTKAVGIGSLGLLGGYADSDSSESSE